MRVTIFDYGAGNIHSLAKALASDDVTVRTERDPVRSLDTDLLVLPGVGAFGAAAWQLRRARDVMRTAISGGLPTLGICLGMQLLFDESEEGPGLGLGILPGAVTRLRAARSPQMGWNSLDDCSDTQASSASLETVYYANGFACRPADPSIVTAWSSHEGDRFPAIVRSGATVGVQFHPEKSSAAGVKFIRAIVQEARR